MNYFRYFPDVQYKFGEEAQPDVIANISIYAEVIDSIRDNVAFYFDYTVPEFERPDQASFNIYGVPDFHWTFFLLNDHIRERGWPVSNRDIMTKAAKDYPYTTITTRTPIATIFKAGQTLTGNSSGTSATIAHRHIGLGQIVVSEVTGGTGTFTPGEILTSFDDTGSIETVTVVSSALEYLSAHHYENANLEWVDIDPTVGPTQSMTEITYLDRLVRQNEELRDIRIIKPSIINQVVKSFREAIRS